MKFDEEFSFCPELVKLYKRGYAEGVNGERFNIGGCSTANNLIILRNLFEDQKPLRTLEIGLAFAGSCLLFTSLHQKAGAKGECQHTAIDPFQTSMWKDAGLLAVESAGLSSFLICRKNFSSTDLPKLFDQAAKFDLIYIDGSHIFEDVFIDFYFAVRLLNEGGVVVFDDCTDANVAKVLKFITQNFRDILPELDLGPHREDKGRSPRYFAAKILKRIQCRAFKKMGNPDRAWNAPLINF